MMITVSHIGEPFELKKTDRINYGKRGRGLQLILYLMDEVKVETNENIVRLVMKKYFNHFKDKGRIKQDGYNC